MLKKLPIGIQTFEKIRDKKENYLYIDKTDIAYDLITSGTYFFLSRPRRFGKSLFLDTLKNIFEGKKELFEDLYIYDKWNWEEKYPVIKISWDGKLRSLDDLDYKLKSTLRENQKRLGVECEEVKHLPSCFEELIINSYEKYNQKVVILIDEYDKPILDVIDNVEQAYEHREYIKGLYSIIKGCDAYVKFAFLTGVSKFAQASIFSGLNMLEDISLSPEFGNICGYTQKDVESTFLPYLKDVDLEKVKTWYNGYNFLKDDVYNPFDLLKFIKNNFMFKNYWFASGTPTFLIKLIEKNNYFLPQLSNLTVDEKLLDSFNIQNLDLEVILYQSGYLTIDKMIEKRRGGFEYKLKLPNEEVRASLFDVILDYILDTNKTDKTRHQNRLYDSLADKQLESLKNILHAMFASIPYNNYTKNNIQIYEGFYASVIFAYLQSLGLHIIGEDVTNRGRIDLSVFIEDIIYIIEFKVGSVDALEQIKEKKYYEKYQNLDKEIYLIGINFDEEKRNISKLEWEYHKNDINYQ